MSALELSAMGLKGSVFVLYINTVMRKYVRSSQPTPPGKQKSSPQRSCLKDGSMEPITYDLPRKYPVSFDHMIKAIAVLEMLLLGQK